MPALRVRKQMAKRRARGAAAFVPIVVPTAGRTRRTAIHLFQPSAAKEYVSTIGGANLFIDRWGPTARHVDSYSGWAWANLGGDWIDSAGVQQGSVAWATFAANSATGADDVVAYQSNVTSLLAYCFANDKPAAFRLAASASARAVCSKFSALGTHSIAVTYTDASSATLACRCVFVSNAGSSVPNQRDDKLFLPVFIEFDRPTKPVAAATMTVALSSHTASAVTVSVMLCSPAAATMAVTGQSGLAAASGLLDSGITGVAGVIGAHRYVDGAALTDFVVPGSFSPNSEHLYSPEFWGGAVDTSKAPYQVNGVAAIGKWVNHDADTHLSLVPSTHTDDGFEPLAPGLGALKLVMEDDGFAPGAEVGSAGSRTGSNMKLFMPPADMGLLDHIFVRYYIRLGATTGRTPANRPEFRQGGNPVWSDLGGKFGIAPSHTTTYGGTSGSSGGGNGWQLRHSWAENESAVGGPNENGYTVGWHLFDFGSEAPEGYRLGALATYDQTWGQQTGAHGVLYDARWYCIECEVKLNSVSDPSPAGDGKFWTPDGVLRTWVDGVLAYERTGCVFRTLPINTYAFNVSARRPARELGIFDLWWNWYNGGTTPSTARRVNFVTGLVWARNRIGPMQRQGSIANINLNTRGDADPSNDPLANPNFPASAPWNDASPFSRFTDFCGAVYASAMDGGTYLQYGGGHSTINPTCFIGFSRGTNQWSRVGRRPLPTNALRGFAAGSNPAPTRFDHTWGDWIGGSTDWPLAFRQPGYNPPEPSHSRNSFVYRPPSVAGNTKGQVIACWHPTGANSGTGIAGSFVCDLDTGLWSRTANLRPSHGSSVGGVAYHAGLDVVVGFNQESSGATGAADFLDCATMMWTRRTGLGSLNLRIDSTSFVVGDLFVYVDHELTPNATPFRLWAISVSKLVANTAQTWQQLTLSASSWPTNAAGVTAMVGFERCPLNGAFYATNLVAGDNRMWRLTPPAADTDAAGLLAGLWTLDSEVLSGASKVAGLYDYSRLRWAGDGFLWTADGTAGAVQLLKPASII